MSGNILGKNLKLFRKKIGLTQAEFAKPLGIKGSYVSDIEKGKGVPSEPILILLELKYRLNRIWLETGKGEMTCHEDEKPPNHDRPLDTDILRQVIKGVNIGLEKKKIKLDEGKMAELITILYEHFSQTEKEVSGVEVERYLRLVS